MPNVPPPEDCKPLFDKPVPNARAGLLVEHRPAAGSLPVSGGDRAEIVVWMRLVEDRALDALLLCFLADSAPPGLYGALRKFVAMPSIVITLHLAHPTKTLDSPRVLGVVRNRVASDGYAIEDGELWTPSGQLVMLTGEFAWSIERNSMTTQVQGYARSEGYRLINPRFEWVPTSSTEPGDEASRQLLCDGVETVRVG